LYVPWWSNFVQKQFVPYKIEPLGVYTFLCCILLVAALRCLRAPAKTIDAHHLHIETGNKQINIFWSWCNRCAFRIIKTYQWCSFRKSWKSKYIVKTVKDHKKKQTKCHEIEPNPLKDRAMPEGDNPSFWDEVMKFTFFLDNSVHSSISKQAPKYCWAIETLVDIEYANRDLDPEVNWFRYN
jgi:hypothetical protein